MARTLAVLLLSVLLSQAFCLQCNTCQGEYDCAGETITCKDPWASCTTSVRKASVSFMDFQTVKKGCARQLFPYESISLNSHMMALSYQSRFCSEDGCNNETYFVSHPAPANHMRCHTCATQGPWCPEGARTQISCVGDQDQCINLDVTGHMGK
uniref:urokinase plasminogen activator surface receptor-like n=1 Tax=Euleptes europaea TaxID=460621 RepID=UPI00253F8ACE|nr:urokinase plasminogen activator surface receptor-like [Euleptes europaea]